MTTITRASKKIFGFRFQNSSVFGFSLVELLVVIGIISVLFSLGFVNYRGFSRKQALVSVARQIEGDLRMAQQYALSGTKPDETETLKGFRFKIAGLVYNIVPVYEDGALGTEGSSIKSEDLSGNISTISTTGGINQVMFKVLGQGTDLVNPFSITLTQANTGDQIIITVSVGGEIKYGI